MDEQENEKVEFLRSKIQFLEDELEREKRKNLSLYYIIGGVICYALGNLLSYVHGLFAMFFSVLAVILSIYGLFNYFDTYSKFPIEEPNSEKTGPIVKTDSKDDTPEEKPAADKTDL